MKKVLLISTVLFLMASGIAFAGSPKENCGCGFGTIFLKEKTDYFIRFLQQQQTVCLAHRPLESVLEPWDAKSLQSWSQTNS